MIPQLITIAMKAAGWEPDGDPTASHIGFKEPTSGNTVLIPTDPSDPNFQVLVGTAVNKFLGSTMSVPKERESKPEEPAAPDKNSAAKVGDWVLVWGKVQGGDAHPDDVIVRFRNHSEDWQGTVGRERVVTPTQNPPFAGRCAAMFQRPDEPDGYVRCIKDDGHSGFHHTKAGPFRDDQVAGRFEES